MSAVPKVKIKAAKTNSQLPTINPNVAGIDIGATALQVAVPCDADPKPVRTVTTFTDDLLKLRDWLVKCGVRTVAMESTSVYWIPLFQILEAAGLEVCLVNARHAKNLPGRKTDVSDCQWLQYLHSVGLLRASFRPPEHICAMRALLRHRSNLIRYAGQQVQHLHKALTQMNAQIHNVLSDIVGMTGLLILDAIVAGERDPHQLARFKNGRVKASRDTIARSLTGNWQPEHLFALKQALTTWRHYQQQIAECDAEIQRVLSTLDAGVDVKEKPLPAARLSLTHSAFDARAELYRVLGVDLTQVPAIQEGTALVLFTELGPNFVAKFPTAKGFASWLGLCPDNRITGGKIISVKTRDVKNRAAMALRLAAQSLWRSKDYLGECFHCRVSQENLCDDLLFLNGAYAESIVVPARIVRNNLLRLKPETAFRDAALVEPLACVVQGVEDTQLRASQHMLVIGAGPVGLMFVALAKHLGCAVTVAGRREARLEAARKLGAAQVIDIGDGHGLVTKVREATKTHFDAVIEAVGKPETWEASVHLVRKGGAVNFFGGCPSGTTITLDTTLIHYSNLTLLASFHHTPRTIRRALEFIETGVIRAEDFVDGECPLSQLPELFKSMTAGNHAVKTLIRVRE